MDDRFLGSARTEADRAVEKVLGTLDRWSGRTIRYAPVRGGLQNDAWRLTVEGEPRRYLIKIPGTGSEAFIDRGAAHEAALRAAELGIGPAPVLFDPATGVEVTEYLESYRACTTGDFRRPELSGQVVELYRALHSAAPLSLTKTVFDMTDEHLEQARALGVRLPADVAGVLAGYEAARAAVLASGLDLVVCHNDPTPGNFLVADGLPMRMIDYEFASNNDRASDVAVLATEMFYDEQRTLALIEAYHGSTARPLVSRVQVFRALADVRWGLWGCVNHVLNTSWDYDYHKYGVWKLMRAGIAMGDPRWTSWLSTL